MKILVTGKNGQVGHELQRSLAPLGEVVDVDVEDDPADLQSIYGKTKWKGGKTFALCVLSM